MIMQAMIINITTAITTTLTTVAVTTTINSMHTREKVLVKEHLLFNVRQISGK